MALPLTRVFAHRNYAWFVGGGTPSYITSWMQRVGVGWLAWELSHSPLWLGIVAAADLAPMLVLSPFAGAITDRHTPLRQLRFTETLLFAQSVALFVFMLMGVLSIWLLVALSLWSGLVYPFHQAARHSVVPAIVPRVDFPTAIALDSALFQVSRFIGPSIAAIIIPLFGVGGTFFAHALGSTVYLFALFKLDYPAPARVSKEGRSILADVKEGLAYVAGDIGIWPLFLLLSVASILLRPMQDMMPGFAGEVFNSGAVGLAWLTSSMGIGAAISAVWIASRGRLKGLTLVVFSGFLGLIVTTIAFILSPALWMGTIFSGLSGFALNTMSTSIQALVQSSLPDHMRGRVMSLYGMIWRGAPALGAVTAGLAAERFGLRATFAVAAGICFIVWLIALPSRGAIALVAERSRDTPGPKRRTSPSD
jgi:MFS family permease